MVRIISTALALSLIAAPYLVASPQATQAATTSAWARYTDTSTGISLVYPKDWTVEKTPEPEVLFKITGMGADGYVGALEFRTTDNNTELSTLAHIVETDVLGKQPGLKKFASGTTSWGRSSRFTGPWQDLTFKMGDITAHQRWYYFRSNKENYIVVFTAPEPGFAKLQPTFNQMLASFEPVAATKTAATPSTRAAQQAAPTRTSWQLTTLNDPDHAAVKVAYPAGWKVDREKHGDERAWKFSGKNAAGHEAEMHLWVSPRGEMTLDQFVETAEEEHLKPLPRYQRLRSSHRTVNGLDAVGQSATFVAEGVPAKIDTVFFTDRDRLYCLGLMSATWTPEEMRDLIDRVAGSIKF